MTEFSVQPCSRGAIVGPAIIVRAPTPEAAAQALFARGIRPGALGAAVAFVTYCDGDGRTVSICFRKSYLW